MRYFLIVFFVFVFGSSASALEIGGVRLPDLVHVADEELLLNGAGIREKFFLNIYAAGLYMEAPSQNGKAIISADAFMQVRLHFVYNGVVDAARLSRGWLKGLQRIVPDADDELQKAMREFSEVFTVDVKTNDVYDITWLPGSGLEVRFNGSVLRVINSLDLKKALFAIWIGDKPGDVDLKMAMLGK